MSTTKLEAAAREALRIFDLTDTCEPGCQCSRQAVMRQLRDALGLPPPAAIPEDLTDPRHRACPR